MGMFWDVLSLAMFGLKQVRNTPNLHPSSGAHLVHPTKRTIAVEAVANLENHPRNYS